MVSDRCGHRLDVASSGLTSAIVGARSPQQIEQNRDGRDRILDAAGQQIISDAIVKTRSAA